ncbi:MAG: hypothetical protein ACYDHP_12775 [Ferrimicrobium sp.]
MSVNPWLSASAGDFQPGTLRITVSSIRGLRLDKDLLRRTVNEDLRNKGNTPLADNVEVRAFHRRCLDECEAWLLAHAGEIETSASVAFEQGRLSIDALNGLHEWIEALVRLRV